MGLEGRLLEADLSWQSGGTWAMHGWPLLIISVTRNAIPAVSWTAAPFRIHTLSTLQQIPLLAAACMWTYRPSLQFLSS